jgi:hypothetical protein
MKILEMYLKVKYYEVNKKSNLHIAIDITKKWSTYAKQPLMH